MWLSASIVAVAVVGGLGAAKMLASIRGGLSLQNGLAHTEYGLAHLSSDLVVGARSVEITSLAQSLQQGETKRETWYGARR